MKLKKIDQHQLSDWCFLISLLKAIITHITALTLLYYRKSEGIPTSASSADLSETASLPLVIKEKDVEYQVNVRFMVIEMF